MTASTFTIELIAPRERDRQYVLDMLADDAFSVAPVNEATYVVACTKPSQLRKVGWLLFHTLVARFCTVIAVSGDAENSADAYSKP